MLPTPKINPDAIFNSVLHSYPEKSKFKIDIVVGIKSNIDEYSDRRFHLFGGRFRTGDSVEYAISAGVIIAGIEFNHII